MKLRVRIFLLCAFVSRSMFSFAKRFRGLLGRVHKHFYVTSRELHSFHL